MPSLHLAYNMLSLATSTSVPVDEENTTRTHEVYLYSCRTGELEIMHVSTPIVWRGEGQGSSLDLQMLEDFVLQVNHHACVLF